MLAEDFIAAHPDRHEEVRRRLAERCNRGHSRKDAWLYLREHYVSIECRTCHDERVRASRNAAQVLDA